MTHPIIELSNIIVRMPQQVILDQVSFVVLPGQHWLITGKSGSGKTALAHVMNGRLFHQGEVKVAKDLAIELVEQQHRFKTLSNTTEFYYQQRFNSTDSEDSLTIREFLREYLENDPSATLHLLKSVHLDQQVDEPLIQLSNGENKRLQIVQALLRKPDLLLLDSPFTGLDKDGRALLHRVIDTVASGGIHVIVFGGHTEIPACITGVLELEAGRVKFAGPRDSYHPSPEFTFSAPTPAPVQTQGHWPDFQLAVKMVNVTVQYEGKVILDKVNWEISKGECWLLSGPNGAGKSTLLSLVTADHPQSYANEIYLFDKRRGRGESIWDIKRNTGLISPELHLFFPDQSTCFEVVASGLFDTIGLFRRISSEEETTVKDWLHWLGLEKLSEKPLRLLSLGQQRMCLLARALVKNPPLLVLDEPCQGLDPGQTHFFNQSIDQICAQQGTTLIYVSHYQEALPPCIRFHLPLDGGRVVSASK